MTSAFYLISTDWQRFLSAHSKTNKKKGLFLQLGILFHNPNMLFVILYRLEHYFFTHNLLPLRYLGFFLYPLYFYINYFILDVHIHPLVKIGKGLYIHYPGIIITQTTSIGDQITLIGPLTIGTDLNGSKGATIGNNVTICTGARIIGNVSLGDNVIVGANAVVVNDFESDVIVGGIPAKVLKKNQ